MKGSQAGCSRAKPNKPQAWAGWTESALAELKRRLAEGESAGRIAAALGCSRSAVIGMARRRGWKFQNPPCTKDGEDVKKARAARAAKKPPPVDPKPSPPKSPSPAAAAAPAPRRLALPEAAAPTPHARLSRFQCQRPVDLSLEGVADADMICCGAPKAIEQPYCAHCARALSAAGGAARLDRRLGVPAILAGTIAA